MQNKNEGNENKIILGDLNCTMDKIDRDGENKWQRYFSNYALLKLIVDNGLEGLTIGLLPRIQDTQGLYWYKNC